LRPPRNGAIRLEIHQAKQQLLKQVFAVKIKFHGDNVVMPGSGALVAASNSSAAEPTGDLFDDWLMGVQALQGGTDVPPPTADFILGFFIRGAHREAMLGHFKERFAQNCKKYGDFSARCCYWVGTLRSVLPLLFRRSC
jgi:hypothetical protein